MNSAGLVPVSGNNRRNGNNVSMRNSNIGANVAVAAPNAPVAPVEPASSGSWFPSFFSSSTSNGAPKPWYQFWGGRRASRKNRKASRTSRKARKARRNTRRH